MPSSPLGRYKPADARDRAAWAEINAFIAAEPEAFGANPRTSHVTGSAFVLDPARARVLLTHHRKLDRWLQLGGHCDGVEDVRFVALREAYEESGLPRIDLVSPDIFDVDIHPIPATTTQPAHRHYDVRFLMVTEHVDRVRASGESKDLAWVPIDRLHEVTSSPSVLVLRDKLPRFGG